MSLQCLTMGREEETNRLASNSQMTVQFVLSKLLTRFTDLFRSLLLTKLQKMNNE